MTRAVTERDLRHPEFAHGEPDEYEFRADGKVVRKDRWEMGIRRIAGALGMSRQSFEISDLCDAVENRISDAEHFEDWLEGSKPLADYESHIKDGNFDHADVVKLMELAYNTGACRL